MNEMQLNKIKKRADEYATSYFPYEKQFLEREAVVKCCVHVVTETIAELEKKNETLSQNLDDAMSVENCLKKRNEVLEKENTELKARVEKKDTDILFLKHLTETQRLQVEASAGLTPWKEIKDKSELIGKLTKAKEHIKKLLDCLKQDTNDPQTNYYVCQYMDKAEQFLSEVEK